MEEDHSVLDTLAGDSELADISSFCQLLKDAAPQLERKIKKLAEQKNEQTKSKKKTTGKAKSGRSKSKVKTEVDTETQLTDLMVQGNRKFVEAKLDQTLDKFITNVLFGGAVQEIVEKAAKEVDTSVDSVVSGLEANKTETVKTALKGIAKKRKPKSRAKRSQ